MSTKKLIQEISMMTHKGIYPSLNILLEEDEGDETPAEMGDEVLDDEDATKEEEGSESEESDETEKSGEPETPETPEAPETPDETSTNSMTLNDVEKTLENIETIITTRGEETALEKQLESFKKNYFNLEKFSLLQEDSSNIVADLQNVLSKFEEKNGFGLDDIQDEVSGGKKINLNFMLDQAKEEISKPFDAGLAILKKYLRLIRKKADVKEIEEKQKKFIDMFEEYCHQEGINITIPEEYKKLSPSNHDVAQGAVKSG